MRRRTFLGLLGPLIVWAGNARGQKRVPPEIGLLSSRSASESASLIAAFHEGLKEAGYVEGRNLAIQYRWAEGHYDRLPVLAIDLVGRKVAVIATTGGTVSALAAKAATATIPIVFISDQDPVKVGLVSNLSRPDANATGISQFTSELEAKRLELLRELIPNARLIAILVNPSYPDADTQVKGAQEAARGFGEQLLVLNAAKDSDFEPAFATLAQRRADALLVASDPFLISRRHELVALAARMGVPAIYQFREYALVGGLMTYGTRLPDSYRQVGLYAGRVLNGAKPADLPVVQSVKFELVMNLKTAKALGLTVPPSLLARADEVIE
jgi:putative tryptophan/tyrosine transport system substrate-binding protein